MYKNCLLYVCIAFVFFACSDAGTQKEALFTRLTPAATGISFENRLADTDTLNILDYLYYYNGGGVAIGDFNNDGLPDIYFTSNKEANKLYLNKGAFQFQDITAAAGVASSGNWKTGVTIADVNNDGWLDIYVSEVGGYKNLRGRNELFINNGTKNGASSIPTFTESAHQYGLDVEGFNTQAVFFDYDHDGDLDMFLVNHSVHSNSSYGDSSMRSIHDEKSGDKLFRNDSTASRRKFTEVTAAAGIYSSVIGYGLNVAIGDLNNDGWDDIYVSNDFHENDYYYLNNGNGTFSEINRTAFGHESRFSMGSAIADMNNDGWLDIITLDMLPPDEKVLKSSAGDDPLDIYNFKLSFGYHHQYSRNCFQLNLGGGKKFSDIALYAGIAATDWSWSPLAADFDNDGVKDLFITNGILRRPNDLDFIKFYSTRPRGDTSRASDPAALEKMPEGKLNNYFFKGTTGIQFIDKTSECGFDHAGFSNGAAYADLDNDGNLDLVVNNLNEPAAVFRNNASHQNNNHYLEIALDGERRNPFGIGAKCTIQHNGRLQVDYLSATHGFESASLQYLHFGTGADSIIDKLQVNWPDGRSQTLAQVKTNQRLVLHYHQANDSGLALPLVTDTMRRIFSPVNPVSGPGFRHTEDAFTDFNSQAFIPHMVSTQGPHLAVADVNGDGLEDFFVCGAKGQASMLFQQTANGNFQSTNSKLFEENTNAEAVNALFFDADNDGDQDLYVVYGGNETQLPDSSLLDRLYLNDGHGAFKRSYSLPAMFGNKSVAVAADVDHDGDADLFVGGRVVAGHYGETPDSWLLLNDGHGNFSIASDGQAPGLRKTGMVTAATWVDLNNDGWQDLAVVGEWMPITIFMNQHGRLVNSTARFGLEHTSGWWTTVLAADLNQDGFPDLLAGNWGGNSKLHANTHYPLEMYVGDFDNNGSPDQILAVAKKGKYYSFLGKEELEKQLPSLMRRKYLDYGSLAGQTVDQIFGDKLVDATKLSAETLSSVCLMNDGHDRFMSTPLPAELEWSPVFSFLTGDFNHDGLTDIISGGNFYGVLPYEGRYDAGFLTLSTAVADHHYIAHKPYATGLDAGGEVRDVKLVKMAGEKQLLLVARNNDSLLFYHVN